SCGTGVGVPYVRIIRRKEESFLLPAQRRDEADAAAGGHVDLGGVVTRGGRARRRVPASDETTVAVVAAVAYHSVGAVHAARLKKNIARNGSRPLSREHGDRSTLVSPDSVTTMADPGEVVAPTPAMAGTERVA